MSELWYRLSKLPDLTLNRYDSLEGSGVDGVLEKHAAFLRQLNRQGIVSELSFHLFYLYVVPEDPNKDKPGYRLNIFFMVRGKEEVLRNHVPALIKASPLAEFFRLESEPATKDKGDGSCSVRNLLALDGVAYPEFRCCAQLTKSETRLPAENEDGDGYYLLREWEMNETGRLYNMCKMMEAMNRTALYRVDLYPVEKNVALRNSLRNPMRALRKKQEEHGDAAERDYDGRDVLTNYEKLLEKFDSSPHFVMNAMAFADDEKSAISILDAAGAESLKKGKYDITAFVSRFHSGSFLEDAVEAMEKTAAGKVLKGGRPGLIVCRADAADYRLNYLPTLFSLEEAAPFFRFPALYDGETVQTPKETAPAPVGKKEALYLGKDGNGYDVYVRHALLPKHAFLAGVPGSGKTNAMLHITSELWKNEIPFLVLEPAKQEYRALLNDPAMRGVYLFSPNAAMDFPLHINPFEMPAGTRIAEHIRRLCTVFEGAFPLDPPMPFLLGKAIMAVYRECGWLPHEMYPGKEPRENGSRARELPTMSMLYRRLEEELKSTQYSEEVRGNLQSALQTRIGSLLQMEMGDVFDVPESTFPPEKWISTPAVIELEAMGPGPANFLTLMLCSLIRETLKVNPRFEGNVRHVIFIEEAHNLIGPESKEQTGMNADPKLAATAFLVKMLAEVRAWGEGIVIADQLPTVMAQEVLKNTGLKIGLRITSADDRALLGSTMAANDRDLEQMATFAVGESLIFYEKLMRPFRMRIKKWKSELKDEAAEERIATPKSDDELKDALAETEPYRDAVARSVHITKKKFNRMFNEAGVHLETCENWAESVAETEEELGDVRRRMREAGPGDDGTGGGLHAYEEREQELLDKTTELTEDPDDLRKALTLIDTIVEWVFTLENLKRERWERYGTPEKEKMKVALLQTKMYDAAQKLYNLLIRGFGSESAPVMELGDEMKRLAALGTQLYNDLNAFVKLYGEEIFYSE